MGCNMVEINWIEWVANQGFAIAVAFFLLIRVESKLDKLIRSIEDLSNEVKASRIQPVVTASSGG